MAITCERCGVVNLATAVACRECGATIGKPSTSSTAILRGLVGGVIGAIGFAAIVALFEIAPHSAGPGIEGRAILFLFGLMWGGIPAFVVGCIAGVIYHRRRRAQA